MLLLCLVIISCIKYLLLPSKNGGGYMACGIFGFSGKSAVDETKLKWLAAQNESRGVHSTGIFTIGLDKNKTQTLLKDTDKATKFIKRADVTEAIKGASLVVGHTRAASWGAVNKANAHPFEKTNKERIIGVHNGFVIQEIAKSIWVGPDKLFEKEFDVDSELIFALLSEYGGDPTILSQIEGAITVAYTVPDKYPGIVHLYARNARTLHFARAKEGIYFSSEDEPLELIGCPEVLKVSDSTLILLKDGEIFDIKVLDLPKIKSLPLNARRLDWEKSVPDAELRQYDVTKPRVYNTNQCQLPFKASNQKWMRPNPVEYNPKKEENDKEIVGMLVKAVQEDMENITPITIPEATEQDSYTEGDFDCCLFVLKLTNSVDNAALPGWVVFVKDNPENSGITMLNGVVPLKFSPNACGVDRTIIMKDPVEGKTIFEYNVKPSNGSIMEVMLQLPFQEEDTQEHKGTSKSSVQSPVVKRIIESGQTQQPVLPASLKLHVSNRGSEGGDQGSLPDEAQFLRVGHSEQQILGTEGHAEEKSGDLHKAGAVTQRNGFSTWADLQLTIISAATIIKKENSTYEYKAQAKKLMVTPEYGFAVKTVSQNVPGVLNVNRLMYDACTLKLHFIEHNNIAFSILSYAIFLLDRVRKHYILDNNRFTKDDETSIVELVAVINSGRFPEPVTKKKFQLTEEITPLEWHNRPNVKLDPGLQRLVLERLN